MFHLADQAAPWPSPDGRVAFAATLATSPVPTAFSPVLFAGDGDAAIGAAHELGYDGIDISVRDPRDPAVSRFADAVLSSGLRIGAIGCGQSYTVDGLSLVTADEEVTARLEARLRDLLDFAAHCGAALIVGGIRGWLADSAAERKEQYSRAAARLHTLSANAESRSVTLLIEPQNRYESNFVNTVREALVLIEDAHAPEVGILVDTFHMNIEERSIADAVALAGARLGHVQLSDSNRRAPGLGHLDFAPVIDALRAIKYSGYLAAEVMPWPSNHEAANQAITFFRNL